jgi:hypothetical protein
MPILERPHKGTRGMTDEVSYTDPGEPEELPSPKAVLGIEQIKLRWGTQAPGFRHNVAVEAATSPRGVVTLAIASVVVTAMGGATAAALRGLGFPIWAALAMGCLPVVTFAALCVAERRCPTITDDTSAILGRRNRRGGGATDNGDARH